MPPAWRVLDDLDVVGLAVAGVAGVAVGGAVIVGDGRLVALGAGCGGVAVMTLAARRGALAPCLVALALLAVGVLRGESAWRAVAPVGPGHIDGWVSVVDDAVRFGGGARVTVRHHGTRLDAVGYGRLGARLSVLEAGERVWVRGLVVAVPPELRRRAAVRHVRGRLQPTLVGDVRNGSPLATSANRVRRLLREEANAAMDPGVAALFTGLVIGDDRAQRPEMLARFRETGMSHLTAVSGQNVVYVIAAASPALRRLRPRARWVATCATIGWFMVVTRFEPSILRAGVMALLTATAFAAGREARPVRTLSASAVLLTFVDPLLVWSVGFWLSTTATLAVCTLGPTLSRALTGRWPSGCWAWPTIGVTVAAQAGVALPSLLVFGRLPLVALVANPVAVPVAGVVMLLGVPAAAAARLLPFGGSLALAPLRWCTCWIDTVARVAVHVEPPPAIAAAGWTGVAFAVTALIAADRRARSCDRLVAG